MLLGALCTYNPHSLTPKSKFAVRKGWVNECGHQRELVLRGVFPSWSNNEHIEWYNNTKKSLQKCAIHIIPLSLVWIWNVIKSCLSAWSPTSGAVWGGSRTCRKWNLARRSWSLCMQGGVGGRGVNLWLGSPALLPLQALLPGGRCIRKRHSVSTSMPSLSAVFPFLPWWIVFLENCRLNKSPFL